MGEREENSYTSARLEGENQALREQLAALCAERDAALAQGRVTAEVLAVMSHEIRTPMNGILGMARLLRDTRLNAVQQDYLSTITHSGEALMTVLNDILDLSRLDSGRFEFEAVPFEPAQILRDVAMLTGQRAREKAIVLETEIRGFLPDTLVGDAARLRQILLNLLGNAVKFTDHGSVRVIVGAKRDERRPVTCLRIEIVDSGIGIAKDSLEHLFEPFFQAESSISRRFGGSGLGLAICRRLVESQGGRIGVASTLGKGSTFWFELDFTMDPAAQTLTAKSAGPPACVRVVRPLSILLAEDNPVNQKVMAGLLGRDGHRVEIVADGDAAVKAARENSYDAILMDMQMPGLDGLAATRAIRNLTDSVANAVPIIALTANAQKSDEERCRAAGMDDYVSKPVDPGHLIAVLRRWTKADYAGTALNADRLRDLVEHLGRDGLAAIIDSFAWEAPAVADKMENALDVGRCDFALELGAQLEGMAQNMGIETMSNLAASLGAACRAKDALVARQTLGRLRLYVAPALEQLKAANAD